jgi:hypothetical protein
MVSGQDGAKGAKRHFWYENDDTAEVGTAKPDCPSSR